MTASRNLTPAEIALAKKVYKSSIDYSLVKVHDGKYTPFQPGSSGMTPKGEIFANGVFKTNYAGVRLELQAFFIHEMAHVYQYQLNILDPTFSAIGAMLKNGFNYQKAYFYELDPQKDLLDYGIEQQAQIIEDYYLIYMLAVQPKGSFMKNNLGDARRDGLFTKVLSKFIADPSYAKHITVCKKRKIGKIRKTFCTRVQVQ